MSRNRKELTERFPELAGIHKPVKASSAILDGEIVRLDKNDLPCFEDLQNRKKCFVVYFAFDLLMLNDNELRNEPLIERKSLLQRILKKSAHLRYTDHSVGEGEQLFTALSKLGLSKRLTGPLNGQIIRMSSLRLSLNSAFTSQTKGTRS